MAVETMRMGNGTASPFERRRSGVKLGFHTWTPGVLARQLNGDPNKRCGCCPYGYHIDLDFVEFCERHGQNSLERINTLKTRRKQERLKRILDNNTYVKPSSAAPPSKDSARSFDPEKELRNMVATPKRSRPRIPTDWFSRDESNINGGARSDASSIDVSKVPKNILTEGDVRNVFEDFEMAWKSSSRRTPDCARERLPPDGGPATSEPLLDSPDISRRPFFERSKSTMSTSSSGSKYRSHVYTLEEQRNAEQLLDSIFGNDQRPASAARSRSNSSASNVSAVASSAPHTDSSSLNLNESSRVWRQMADAVVALNTLLDSLCCNNNNNNISDDSTTCDIRKQFSYLLRSVRQLEEQSAILQMRSSAHMEEKRLLQLQLKVARQQQLKDSQPAETISTVRETFLLSPKEDRKPITLVQSSNQQKQASDLGNRRSKSTPSSDDFYRRRHRSAESSHKDDDPSSTATDGGNYSSSLLALLNPRPLVLTKTKVTEESQPKSPPARQSLERKSPESEQGSSFDSTIKRLGERAKLPSATSAPTGRKSPQDRRMVKSPALQRSEEPVQSKFYSSVDRSTSPVKQLQEIEKPKSPKVITKSTGIMCSVNKTDRGCSAIPEPLKRSVGVNSERVERESCKKCVELESELVQRKEQAPKPCSVCSDRKRKLFKAVGSNTDRTEREEPKKPPPVCEKCSHRPIMCNTFSNTDKVFSKETGIVTDPVEPAPSQPENVMKKVPVSDKPHSRSQGTQVSRTLVNTRSVQVTPQPVARRDSSCQPDTNERRHIACQSERTVTNIGVGDYDIKKSDCPQCANTRKRSLGVGLCNIHDKFCVRCDAVPTRSVSCATAPIAEVNTTDTGVSVDLLPEPEKCLRCTEAAERVSVAVGDYDINQSNCERCLSRPSGIPRPEPKKTEKSSVACNTEQPTTTTTSAPETAGPYNLSRTSSGSSMLGIRVCDKCSTTIENVAKEFIDKNVFDPQLPQLPSKIPKLSTRVSLSPRPQQKIKPKPLSIANRQAMLSPSLEESSPVVTPEASDTPIKAPVERSGHNALRPGSLRSSEESSDSSSTTNSSDEDNNSSDEGTYNPVSGQIIMRRSSSKAINTSFHSEMSSSSLLRSSKIIEEEDEAQDEDDSNSPQEDEEPCSPKRPVSVSHIETNSDAKASVDEATSPPVDEGGTESAATEATAALEGVANEGFVDESNVEEQTCEGPHNEGVSEEGPSFHDDYIEEDTINTALLNYPTNFSPPPPREKYDLPKEVKAACKVLNDYLMKPERGDPNKLKTAVTVIQQEWFRVASPANADAIIVEDYMDHFEDYSRHLLHRIVNMSDVNGNSALHYAVSHANYDVISILLDSKVCDVSKQNKAGYTPLMLMALADVQNDTQRHVVQRLFSMGDVNIKATQNGQTALMLACSHGRVDTVRMLLECGAEPNVQDNDGSTALMCAAEHGYLDVVRLLLANPDVETNIADNDGSTALAIAMEAGHKDTALLIYASTNFSRGSSPYSSLRGRKGTPRTTPPPSRPPRTPPPPSPSRSRKGSTSSMR